MADQLFTLLADVDCAIIYCLTIKNAEFLYEELSKLNLKLSKYHSKVEANQRMREHRAWQEGSANIMIATSAFGMGIDKPDVSLIIHAQMPLSLGEYYQQVPLSLNFFQKQDLHGIIYGLQNQRPLGCG